MSRVARVVVPGIPHHITQRGNRHADIFETDDDRLFYLRVLRKYADKHGLSIWAYCLMTNHIHLVAVPKQRLSLGNTCRDAHTVYAMRFNRQTEMTGHVWQGRFYSCPLDESHLWAAVRYVERNPVRAGMVEQAADYKWSSAHARCTGAADPLLADNFPPFGVIENWSEWLAVETASETEAVRTATRTGRPCGSFDFVETLEGMLKRRLRPSKRGRKRRGSSGKS